MVMAISPVWTNNLLFLFYLLSITVQTKSCLTNDAGYLIASYAGHMTAHCQPLGLAIEQQDCPYIKRRCRYAAPQTTMLRPLNNCLQLGLLI